MDAVAPAAKAERMTGYGAAETIDRAAMPLPEAIARAHPDGIDVLVDVASDAAQFAALAGHVRPGGTAVTTRYVADPQTLARAGVTGVNFALSMTAPLLDRLAAWVAAGSVVPPPITRVSLDDVPALLAGPRTEGTPSSRCRPSRAPHAASASPPDAVPIILRMLATIPRSRDPGKAGEDLRDQQATCLRPHGGSRQAVFRLRPRSNDETSQGLCWSSATS